MRPAWKDRNNNEVYKKQIEIDKNIEGCVNMLEIIAVTLEEAIQIEKWGGTQIELISGFAEGGLTPSYGLIERVMKNVKYPVNVMLRPHSRSFHYSSYDLDVMGEDAKIMESIGVKSVVVGILDQNGYPDIKAIEGILKGTNLQITFHRAFDETRDLFKSLEVLKSYERVKTILTSGGKGKAVDNIAILKKIIENRGSIEILLGSGVSYENIGILYHELKNPNFHVGTAVRQNHFNNEIDKEEVIKIIRKIEEQAL